MTLQPNSTLQGGKYKIEKVLGQGGFGITYLAEQTLLGRKVAIKEFFMKELCDRDASSCHVTMGTSGARATVERFREKFLKEAKLIAQMSNHHIVQIFDIFEENGTAYYVMEHLDGGSLGSKVDKGALIEKEALHYTFEIADALNYIHSQNVLHLDVKPSNILFRHNGEAVLIDFGISKHYDDNGGQTTTTPIGFSKGYAPMEQYNPGLTRFTPATDIYSLGATMYKMLTGTTPPEAMSLLNEVEELKRPQGISSSTWNAIEKSMEAKVKSRPQSIHDFLSLLDSSFKEVEKAGTRKVDEVDEVTVLVEPKVQQTRVGIREDNDIVEFNVSGVPFKMIRVEGGTFQMGATLEQRNPDSDEKPVHSVTLNSYYIGQTEVTQALWQAVMGRAFWQAVMGSNPSGFKGSNLPVENVSWKYCQKFITMLNQLTGQKFRLPTEAEWEYAARGGNKTKGYQYAGSNNLDAVAWYYSNSDSKTHPVATKQPNELGLYDMSGNVWEWCQDWYGSYSSSAITNPSGPTSGSVRVYRGGSWSSGAGGCRSANRINYTPVYRISNLGLRLALSLEY